MPEIILLCSKMKTHLCYIIEEYNKKSYWHKADEFAGIFILLRIQFVNLVIYIVMITSLIKDLRKTTQM